MTNKNDLLACRVCGLIVEDYYPWGENGDLASFDICGCCGAEFGYDDFEKDDVLAYRKEWLEKGGDWRFKNEKPENWNREEQMKNIPDEFK